MHFFEALERKIDFQKEFEKLEYMVVCERSNGWSVESWISSNFREWEHRRSFSTFMELREHLGFKYDERYNFTQGIDLSKYFLYCEMLLNLFWDLQATYRPSFIDDQQKHIVETLMFVVDQSGYEYRQIDLQQMIVEKNAVAIEVADKVPELADVIVEYNHYLLRGDIEKKKLLLKQIADALEPKRKTMEGINKEQTSNFFELVNSMNVRHNNLDPADKGKYNAVFASYTSAEQEEWYDLIYEQALMLFMLLEQQDRNKKINAYKQARAGVK